MHNNTKKHFIFKWKHIILALLVIALVIAFFLFMFDIKNLFQTGMARPALSRIHRRFLPRPTFTAQQIQGWMTFRYINYVFRLPANYLATTLNINNSGYLNLTLDKYAGTAKLNAPAFAESVRQAAAKYLSGVSK